MLDHRVGFPLERRVRLDRLSLYVPGGRLQTVLCHVRINNQPPVDGWRLLLELPDTLNPFPYEVTQAGRRMVQTQAQLLRRAMLPSLHALAEGIADIGRSARLSEWISHEALFDCDFMEDVQVFLLDSLASEYKEIVKQATAFASCPHDSLPIDARVRGQHAYVYVHANDVVNDDVDDDDDNPNGLLLTLQACGLQAKIVQGDWSVLMNTEFTEGRADVRGVTFLVRHHDVVDISALQFELTGSDMSCLEIRQEQWLEIGRHVHGPTAAPLEGLAAAPPLETLVDRGGARERKSLEHHLEVSSAAFAVFQACLPLLRGQIRLARTLAEQHEQERAPLPDISCDLKSLSRDIDKAAYLFTCCRQAMLYTQDILDRLLGKSPGAGKYARAACKVSYFLTFPDVL
jgi:hypothetical protein